MPYNRHANEELIEAYDKQPLPYQGADPTRARCIFIGLDANFEEHIENSIIFHDVLTYLNNGPEFWRQRGSHHPFLLDGYAGGGRFYHENFARIGFTTQHADCVSFVELLPFPTYGRSNLNREDLSTPEIQEHLRKLNDIILCGNQRIFITTTVGQLLKRSSAHFAWLPNEPSQDRDGLLVYLKRWHNDIKDCVYWHTFFSRWDSQSEVAKMNERLEIRRVCMIE